MYSQKALIRKEMRHDKFLLHKITLSVVWQMLRKLLLQISLDSSDSCQKVKRDISVVKYCFERT